MKIHYYYALMKNVHALPDVEYGYSFRYFDFFQRLELFIKEMNTITTLWTQEKIRRTPKFMILRFVQSKKIEIWLNETAYISLQFRIEMKLCSSWILYLHCLLELSQQLCIKYVVFSIDQIFFYLIISFVQRK